MKSQIVSVYLTLIIMESNIPKLNPHISIDCVVFGFDGTRLKLLLIRRKYRISDNTEQFASDLKLPGDMINDVEGLDSAAYRILYELTGIREVYLKQLKVFGDPGRISKQRDLLWLEEQTGFTIERVVTVAYYSLIKIDESKIRLVKSNNAIWLEIDKISELAFDHMEIVQSGLKTLRERLKTEPVGMELLPEKFTIRQLQNLYEVILQKELDNRNFRKKVLKAEYLIPLNEKETGVAHKPARLYKFDHKKYLTASSSGRYRENGKCQKNARGKCHEGFLIC